MEEEEEDVGRDAEGAGGVVCIEGEVRMRAGEVAFFTINKDAEEK